MTESTWVKVYPRQSLFGRLGWPVLTATPSGSTINLSWTPAGPTTTGYEVSVNGTISDVGLVTSHPVTGLPVGVEASFMVRPYDSGGLVGGWSAVAVATPSAFNSATGGTVTDIPDYNGTGETWRVHTFIADGTFTVAGNDQPFRTLIAGGGGGGGVAMNANGGGKGRGGKPTVNDSATLATGPIAVTVGGGGGRAPDQDWGGGATGGTSSLGASSSGGGGGGGGGESPYTGPAYSQNEAIQAAYNDSATWVSSDITGTTEKYGHDGSWGGPQYEGPNGQGYGGGGRGGGSGWGNRGTPTGGNGGVVIVAYRIG